MGSPHNGRIKLGYLLVLGAKNKKNEFFSCIFHILFVSLQPIYETLVNLGNLVPLVYLVLLVHLVNLV